jgi:hypothetical protein
MTALVMRALPRLPLWEPDAQTTCAVAYDLCSSPEEIPADPRRVAGAVAAHPAPHCEALHTVAPGRVLSLMSTTPAPPSRERPHRVAPCGPWPVASTPTALPSVETHNPCVPEGLRATTVCSRRALRHLQGHRAWCSVTVLLPRDTRPGSTGRSSPFPSPTLHQVVPARPGGDLLMAVVP